MNAWLYFSGCLCPDRWVSDQQLVWPRQEHKEEQAVTQELRWSQMLTSWQSLPKQSCCL